MSDHPIDDLLRTVDRLLVQIHKATGPDRFVPFGQLLELVPDLVEALHRYREDEILEYGDGAAGTPRPMPRLTELPDSARVPGGEARIVFADEENPQP